MEMTLSKELSAQVGDKVRIKGEDKVRVVRRILPDGCIMFGDKGNIYSLKDIEPYTETKDNIEEKELNLYELLKDAIGEEIYSPTFGVVKVSMANCNCIGVDPWNHNSKSFKTDGRYVDKANAVISLFPSKALYEKYPLDAYSAWMEWKESRKPKWWRAEKGEIYWFFDRTYTPYQQEENGDIEDEIMYDAYNYFRTKEEAQQAAEIIRKTLIKIHEQNQK